MKKIVLATGVALFAALVRGVEYTFVAGEVNWSDDANWSPSPPVWNASATGIVAGATAIWNNNALTLDHSVGGSGLIMSLNAIAITHIHSSGTPFFLI